MDHESGWLTITVADKGVGFDAKDIDLENGGTGFGLFSLQQRAEALGGRVDGESSPGRGSRFELVLPLDGDDEGPEGSPGAVAEAPEEYALETLDASLSDADRADDGAIRVLLVDDHAVIRDGLRSLLARTGDMRVVGEAADGRQGVEQALELRPNVVLMDVAMPGMDGTEATRRIKERVPDTHVVALSMFDLEQVEVGMLEAGADVYMTKDGESENLLAAIRDCVKDDR